MNTPAHSALRRARLYGILDLGYVTPEDSVEVAGKMLEGGVEILQLRAKGLSPARIVPLAKRVAARCRAHVVPFILNDHPDLVAESEADGVHVGQDDLSIAEARLKAGSKALVGRSTHDLSQARRAMSEGADYLGFGPLFATPTKPDYQPIGLADIAAAHALGSAPIFCIGGIKRENLADVVAAGARRVVIVSGILQAADIPAYCRAVLDLLPPAE